MQSVCRYLGGNTARPYCDDLDNKDNALERAGRSVYEVWHYQQGCSGFRQRSRRASSRVTGGRS